MDFSGIPRVNLWSDDARALTILECVPHRLSLCSHPFSFYSVKIFEVALSRSLIS